MTNSSRPPWAELTWKLLWLQAVAAYGFTGRECEVAVMYLNRFNANEGGAWPSLEWLADALNIDRRNLRRLIDHLEDAGFLTKVREGCGAESSVYVPRLPTGLSIVDQGRGHTNVHPATLNPAFKPKAKSLADSASRRPNNKWGLPSPRRGGVYAPTLGVPEPSREGAYAPSKSTREPTSETTRSNDRDSSRGDLTAAGRAALPDYPADAVRQLRERFGHRFPSTMTDARLWKSALAFQGLRLTWPELVDMLEEALRHLDGPIFDLFDALHGNAEEMVAKRDHAGGVEAEWQASQTGDHPPPDVDCEQLPKPSRLGGGATEHSSRRNRVHG